MSITNNSSNMAFGHLPNFIVSETNAEDFVDYYRCQMKLGGLTETEAKMILTLLKGLQSRSNDIDNVASLVTNALKNIDVKTIRIEELAAMIILCKYQPIESIEALIIKKACEKKTRKEGTKDVPCFATAKEIVEIIKEANSYAIAVSGENREVKRIINNKLIDRRRKSCANKMYSDKEKSYNKRVCFKCDKPGHFIANCKLMAKRIEEVDNEENLSENEDSRSLYSVVKKITSEGYGEIMIECEVIIDNQRSVIKDEDDCSSPRTLISMNHLSNRCIINKYNDVTFKGIGGIPTPIVESCEAKIKLRDRVVITTVLITELPYSLYGRKELYALGLLGKLHKEKVGKIVTINKKSNLINDKRKVMKNEFYKIFVKLTDGKLGLVKNFEAKLPIKLGAVTKIVPPRPYQCEQIIPLIEEKIRDDIKNSINETPVGCRNESPREMLNRNREGFLMKPLSKGT
uniref:CCHC-type domain-containing protein n=1 Tax=Strongyloides venezuelensis TaxID=75913 RepID=A0A0K0F043_STRVS